MPTLTRKRPQVSTRGYAARSAHADFDLVAKRHSTHLAEFSRPHRRQDMNRDQVKGKSKEIAGKVQQKFGEAVGSTSQQVKGAAKQVEGNVQKRVGDADEALRESERKTRS
jgi:uncharacterized protein YjbJ (UPF0337 family)